jgi:hypothetical protein
VVSRAEAGPGIERTSGLTWQEQFDRWFPQGALVEVVVDVPGNPDAPTFLTSRVLAASSEQLRVRLIALDVKATEFDVGSLEDFRSDAERASGGSFVDIVLNDSAGLPHYRLTNHIEPQAAQTLLEQKMSTPWLWESF